MLNVIFRTIILYFTVIIVIRIMGKRQVGELQPFELAITIMISALAAFPMEDIGIPLIYSLIPILLMLVLQVIISEITLNVNGARVLLCGKPGIVIHQGNIVEAELRKQRLNLTDLLEQLRIKGYHSISDVEYAIMETTGELSVIPTSDKRPLHPDDIGIKPDYEGIPLPLIIDGEVEEDNLKEIQKNKKWLYKKLSMKGIKNPNKVFFATLDTAGNFICQTKETTKGEKESE
ncbi:MAG: DUF421 domain-containing protein [Halanaerobiales bacterium]